jgi:superfamily II DNA/RNA helicase/nucleoside-triphosphatase THEP1
MAEFNIGDVVNDINTNQRGTIVKVLPFTRGDQKYSVFFSQDETRDVTERDLEKPIEVKDLFDRCVLGDYRGYNDFQVYNTTFKIENSSNNTLSSIKASRTMFKTYQYIPLMKFLNSDLQRLLIADEVGLGKTIEAGHIMLELKARGELKNVLVVCPSGLRNKWQDELEERFGLNFRIFEKKDELRDELRNHNGHARGIITYELLRDTKNKSVLNEIENQAYQFSLVVCDEAHRLRNASSKIHDTVERLLPHAQAAIFLTATPIMLGRENLFHLLNLLNNQRYDSLTTFEDESRHNEPFVWALNNLNESVSLAEIRKGLDERIPENDYVRKLPLFEPLMEKLAGEDTPKQRTLIQSDLYDINPLSSILSRTRKVDVTKDLSQAKRDTRTISITLNSEEKGLFDRFMKALDEKEPISRSTPQQRIASSIFAYDGNLCYDDEDTKFNALMRIIKENQLKGNGKVLVFAQFHATLHYLENRLNGQGVGYRVISGEINDRESRIHAVDDFRTKESVTVLLSSEVGGEGLDMQFCDTIVNYDLPWNPMVVEQRIGRIDRIGQRSEIIHIYNLLVKGTVQEKIHDRLQKRIEEFRNTIGDLEPILSQKLDDNTTIGEEINNNLYRTDLTEQEREEKLRRIERAIERNLEDSKKVKRELSSTFTSDSYLHNHLDSIIYNKAYVTEQELENYVRMLFRKELPTCTISDVDDKGIAVISVPQCQPKTIIGFLDTYTTLRGENGDMVKSFINTIRDRASFKVTFRQDVAEANRSVPYLSIYHPLVIVAKERMKDDVKKESGVFRYQVKETDLEMKGGEKFNKGYYVLAIYNVTTESFRYGKSRKTQEVHPVLYDVQKMDIENNPELVDAIYRAVQTSGNQWDSKDVYRLDKNAVDDIRSCFADAIRDYRNEYKEIISRKQRNDIEHQRNGIIARYDKMIDDEDARIKEFERLITAYEGLISVGWAERTEDFGDGRKGTIKERKENLERVLPARIGSLNKMRDEYAMKKRELDTVCEPIVTDKLMMLNLIKVI